ncbi:MAG TPA: ATP-binding protein, partial [Terriglobales bacterium]|nr:ATP-binding protein [Terriglobales bacterium]
NLLRIGQEAICNALKHGKANRISVHLRFAHNMVRFEIGDDGCGFTPTLSGSSGHFGLLDMRERAQSMGSKLQIASEPGRGTRVLLEMAVEQKSSIDEAIKIDSYSGS